ncbi:MAG: hypothetical protein H7Y07_08970 [Pyrinomonadaceae bacterium]|nr:hypothetical protein [Sphingobacteriaceae bacterium]
MKLIEDSSIDSILKHLEVRLYSTPLLGEIKATEQVIFEPLIDLSPGLHYRIFYRNKFIGEIQVPEVNKKNSAKLIAIYPSSDTLPENLLKIYFHFSAPMREGEALKHISLLNNGDTLKNTFLDLQPELWNPNRTVLTLWLDPGRIKRDLIPNQKMGNPLKAGQKYQLKISTDWKDAKGLNLSKGYIKDFVTGSPDYSFSTPSNWILKLPQAHTRQALHVILKEPLDYFLLQETLSISGPNELPLRCAVKIGFGEKSVSLIPEKNWASGNYLLKINPILEDLAGNNLNRPFDRDINAPSARISSELKFKIN